LPNIEEERQNQGDQKLRFRDFGVAAVSTFTLPERAAAPGVVDEGEPAPVMAPPTDVAPAAVVKTKHPFRTAMNQSLLCVAPAEYKMPRQINSAMTSPIHRGLKFNAVFSVFVTATVAPVAPANVAKLDTV
jgi:hypothetical protein